MAEDIFLVLTSCRLRKYCTRADPGFLERGFIFIKVHGFALLM